MRGRLSASSASVGQAAAHSAQFWHAVALILMPSSLSYTDS
jgi:hypothetical protein